MTYAWSIFIVIVILGFLSYFLFFDQKYIIGISESISDYTNSISGKALFSQEIIEIPEKVEQNSYLQVTINPSSKGIYKFAYIYNEKDKLIERFSFDCEDICKEKKTARVFINNSYSLGNYVAVFDYSQDKYIKKDFEVVEETKLAVGQTKLSFQTPVYLGSNKFMQFYKPNGNNGSNAWLLLIRQCLLLRQILLIVLGVRMHLENISLFQRRTRILQILLATPASAVTNQATLGIMFSRSRVR